MSPADAVSVLSRFRGEFYECLYARANALFEITDALSCKDGPVQTLVEIRAQARGKRERRWVDVLGSTGISGRSIGFSVVPARLLAALVPGEFQAQPAPESES
jgi:hypothetical protein